MTPPGAELSGVALHSGKAAGTLLVLESPLSFWGGSDLATGQIVDQRHPQCGASMAGRVLAMHSGRGSSSSSSVLAEQIRLGVSPAAIVLGEADPIIVLGAIVAAELYGKQIPIVMLTIPEIDSLADGLAVEVASTVGKGATIQALKASRLASAAEMAHTREDTMR